MNSLPLQSQISDLRLTQSKTVQSYMTWLCISNAICTTSRAKYPAAASVCHVKMRVMVEVHLHQAKSCRLMC